MANKIRGKLKYIIRLAPIGGSPIPLSTLGNLTPAQHCAENKGEFSSPSLDSDLCVTARGKVFSDDPPNSIISGFTYHYNVVEDIELTPETDAMLPTPNRTSIGVGEGITIHSNVPVLWEINSSLIAPSSVQSTSYSQSIHLTALNKAGSVTIFAKNDDGQNSISLTIVEPTGVKYSLKKYPNSFKQMIFHPKNGFVFVVGLEIAVLPDTVNFENIMIRELDSAANTSGIFDDGKVHCHLKEHGAAQPAGTLCDGVGQPS